MQVLDVDALVAGACRQALCLAQRFLRPFSEAVEVHGVPLYVSVDRL